MYITSDLKIHFLGIIPFLQNKTDSLNPEEILSLSGLLTFQGKSLQEIRKKTPNSKKEFKQLVKTILEESSLRGHASMATTPNLCFHYEGSKFLDLALTGFVFSSSIVSSGRRTQTSKKDTVFPTEILKNRFAKKIYEQASKENIENFNYFLKKGVEKDQASKILQYGIYSAGVINFPIETLLTLKREYETEKNFMPDEIGDLIKKIEEKLEEFGILNIYHTRYHSPCTFYPYPNIFKDPQKINLIRGLKTNQDFKLISFNIYQTKNFKKQLQILRKEIKKLQSLKSVRKNWRKVLILRQEIIKNYNLAVKFKFLSSVPWRVWSEKKRHRTCPILSESIYLCVKRAQYTFLKFKKEIRKGEIDEKIFKKIENIFSIPRLIKKNEKFLRIYLLSALKSFEAYKKLVSLNIKEKNAIFLIPRAIKINVLQEYDLFNLIAGYYPLRICQTAEEEMRRGAEKEIAILKKYLKKERLDYLSSLILPKCNLFGFCPEKNFCQKIKDFNKRYDLDFHQNMNNELRISFAKQI